MGAAIMPARESPNDPFWDRLHALENRHRDLQLQQEQLNRALDGSELMLAADEFRATWRRYCEVIAELEKTAEQFVDLQPEDL